LEFARLQAGRESTDTDFDDLLNIYIPAATAQASAWCGIDFILQSYAAYWDYFPAVLEIQGGWAITVTALSYYDSDDVQQVILPSDYYVYDRYNAFVQITPPTGQVWPSTIDKPDAVTVSYSAGFGPDHTYVPYDIQLAIATMTTMMLGNRGDCADSCGAIPCAAMRLLAKYKPMVMR
jgi:uncharacterized phiE125 gp8 family phage protein